MTDYFHGAVVFPKVCMCEEHIIEPVRAYLGMAAIETLHACLRSRDSFGINRLDDSLVCVWDHAACWGELRPIEAALMRSDHPFDAFVASGDSWVFTRYFRSGMADSIHVDNYLPANRLGQTG